MQPNPSAGAQGIITEQTANKKVKKQQDETILGHGTSQQTNDMLLFDFYRRELFVLLLGKKL